MPPASPTLADFEGTWHVNTVLEGMEDPNPVGSTLTGSGGSWTLMLEGRGPIAATATIYGDSLIVQSDAFESILREGVTVSIRSALVRQDEGVSGNVVASYRTADGVEIVHGTMTGTRQ